MGGGATLVPGGTHFVGGGTTLARGDTRFVGGGTTPARGGSCFVGGGTTPRLASLIVRCRRCGVQLGPQWGSVTKGLIQSALHNRERCKGRRGGLGKLQYNLLDSKFGSSREAVLSRALPCIPELLIKQVVSQTCWSCHLLLRPSAQGSTPVFSFSK